MGTILTSRITGDPRDKGPDVDSPDLDRVLMRLLPSPRIDGIRA